LNYFVFNVRTEIKLILILILSCFSQVQGIPHLVILDRNGAVIEDKVQGSQLTEASMMRWMQGLKSV
jgi:hypothetical protein